MKRVHVAAGLGAALPAAVLSGLTVYLLGAPEWAPWLTLFVTYAVYAVGFLIVVEALTEESPMADRTEESPVAGLTFVAERRRFKPVPHFEAKPAELFAGLINDDDTALMPSDYQGQRRAGAR